MRRQRNSLKNEMQRVSRANWRRLVNDVANSTRAPSDKGLWQLSRWSRRQAGKAHADPHMPALKRRENDDSTNCDQERTAILAEKFFPEPLETDADDEPIEAREELPGPFRKEIQAALSPIVTQDEVEYVLRTLPAGKSPGPDGIPNEVLKGLTTDISAGMAQAISRSFAGEPLPSSFQESITLALRKEGKRDYSLPGSYRPIALENTLAKVVEKILALRMRDVAEELQLLPWNQMGARQERSTESAISLLTTCVQTAWRAKPGSVVSMLSLDLAGAYDNVPHAVLLRALRKKRLPEWMITAVERFTQARRTRIAIPGYESDWIPTRTGIPQGSPLSPILFLFYIADLLEEFQDPQTGTLGFGFIDDTNLVTWSNTAQENCQKLEEAHQICEQWARRSGARFAPEKY